MFYVFLVQDASILHIIGASYISLNSMPIAPTGKSVRTSVILPENLHARIQAVAESNNVSAAWIIRAAVVRFLDEHGEETQLPLKLPKMNKGA